MAEYITRETFSWIESDRGIVGEREGLEKIGELIRCKDCKWFYEGKWFLRFMYALLPEDYCSYAERREE